MNRDLALVFAFFLLILASHGSDADRRIWNLHLRFALSKDSPQESIAPAPAPGPSSLANGKSGSPTPAILPFPSSTTDKCNSSYNTCRDLKNMIACLVFLEEGMNKGYFLKVLNKTISGLDMALDAYCDKDKEVEGEVTCSKNYASDSSCAVQISPLTLKATLTLLATQSYELDADISCSIECCSYTSTFNQVSYALEVLEQYLLIQNVGETALKVNATISYAKYKEIQVPEHHTEKVNISDVPENSMIILDAGNGKCMIHVGSLTKNGSIFKQISSYVTHLNLASGSYILFSIVLIIGGVWACCKMGTKERHADGVPYQELELAEHDSSPTNDLEAAEGWDQGWDDDWDESKPADKSSSHTKANGSSNGINSRSSDRDGWGNDWDD